jgi:hypothetical protein
MSELAKKAYPYKRNQEHNQGQEGCNQNCVELRIGVSQIDERRHCSMTYII